MKRQKAVAPDMSVSIGALKLKNPVLAASGTFGYGVEHSDFFDAGRLGGIITKGLSLKPRKGNPPPRIFETPSGMLNAIGLENIGIEAFGRNCLPLLEKMGTAVIVNFFGDTLDEYSEMASVLDGMAGVHAVEVNISCPNVRHGGIAFGKEPSSAAAVTEAIRSMIRKPIIVKLSPASDVVAVAVAVEKAGADAVSCINTYPGMAIDIETGLPRLANVSGGLSGPAIRPIAVKIVYDVSRAVKIPVIGVGGIMNAGDALELVIAGAAAVQVGTATMTNPKAAGNVLDGLEAFCLKRRIQVFASLVGSVCTRDKR